MRRTRSPHAEWLGLLEVSGPFLTLGVLNGAFPGGLPPLERGLARRVGEARAEWEESGRTDPGIHTQWIRLLLHEVLEYLPECLLWGQEIPPALCFTDPVHGERVAPSLVIHDPEDPTRTRIPILELPAGRRLNAPEAGARWPASPEQRMQLLLQSCGLQVGYVTNGSEWTLVHVRAGSPTGFVTWRLDLLNEEPLTLRAFRALLGAARVYGAAPGQSLTEMLDAGAGNQEEVTRELGRQVRQAVEVFLNALERLDRESGRTLLAGVASEEVYDAALTVMMRLVFLFCAEQNDLLPRGDIYDRHYAASTLNDLLREAADREGEEVLEHRHDAWLRLLALFRLIHGGCLHEDLNLPAYGGSLFDPERYPFLEGRAKAGIGPMRPIGPIAPLRIDNRVALHLLDALEYLRMAAPGGGVERRRLSFRSLGVEEIGHVYEGLLDHTARRAPEPILGLRGRETEEPELPLAALEAEAAKGPEALAAMLARHGVAGSEASVRRLLDGEPEPHLLGQLTAACGGDETLAARVRPFLGVVRTDSLDHLQIYPAGALYMTAGQDRRSTGTHYTPVTLTEEIVRHTLEPLVYRGPADGLPPQDWRLRTPEEILDLKLVDSAMGSGAFLVQACRFLAERLVEAWGEESAAAALTDADVRTIRVTPLGHPALPTLEELVLPEDAGERLVLARRLAADHCLYGVDKNPMAVEMAKLSLWLVTLARGKPFSFLDHRLKHGDSLAGTIWRETADGSLLPLPPAIPTAALPTPDLRKQNERELTGQLTFAPALASAPEAEAYSRLSDFPDTPEGQADKQSAYRRLHESEAARRRREAADLWMVPWFPEVVDAGRAVRPSPGWLEGCPTTSTYRAALESGVSPPEPTLALVQRLRERLPIFHWALEFPDVYARGGFDAVLSNPPFQGGQKITGALGTDYRDYLVQALAGSRRGSADLCAYFFLRAARLLRPGGGFGMLATNTIAQGDTREVGLDHLLGGSGNRSIGSYSTYDSCDSPPPIILHRAHASMPWPGSASLEVAVVWGRRGPWSGGCVLDGKRVPAITAFLTAPGAASGKPHRLAANAGKSFIGSYVLGMGFVLTPEAAQGLIARDPRNRDVLFPYLNGEDLNSRPDQSASRWVINCRDWPLDRSAPGRWTDTSQENQRKWLRTGRVPPDYPGPVAADYPDCLEIVERLVKPERDRNARRERREKWWHYAEKCPALYATIAGLERVLALSLVNNHLGLAFCASETVFAHKLAVFPLPHCSSFALLQSGPHYYWAWHYSSTMRMDINYSPSDCFESFPFPEDVSGLEGIGEAYNAHRQSVMLARREGLTKTYNRFHSPAETAEDIRRLRDLHVEMDRAVLAAYGWPDLDPGHGFHETKQGIRYTFHPTARQEVLDRLLLLNHARYAAEVEAGLHEGKRGRGRMEAERAGDAGVAGDPDAGLLSPVQGRLFEDQPSLGDVLK